MKTRGRHATIAEVARLAGVAKSTASLAFSSPDRVKNQTLDRIKKAAEEIGYAPSIAAQSLKTGRNNLIGLLVADLQNPHSGSFVSSAQNAALERGHFAIAAVSGNDLEYERILLNRFKSMRIKGIILAPAGHGDDYARRIMDVGARIVAYDHKIDALDCDHVGLDNAVATTMLTQHMIKLGHRNIAYVSGKKELWSAQKRLEGYTNTMRRAGLAIDDQNIVEGNYDRETSYQAAISILRRRARPTGIITANNDTAIGTMLAMRSLGLDCPGDVSLATVDVIANNELMTPQVTAVSQPVTEMAQIATAWLFDRLESDANKADAPARIAMVAPSLIIGTSTRRI